MSREIKVAIQGGKASFHDEAAHLYFSLADVTTVPCNSFRELCEVLEKGACDCALMAIENVIAGSIRANFNLLHQYNFSVIGEKWLAIEQNLMALPGQELEDIRLVISHPVALQQCNEFLAQHPHLQAQQTEDTAESARAIREQNLSGVAAIASRQAAKKYKLQLLATNIADRKENYTRFLILSKTPAAAEADKATLLLELTDTDHRAVTSLLKKVGVHTSLMEEIRITNATALLALDVVAENQEQLQSTIERLRPLASRLHVKGLYKHTPHPLAQRTTTLSSTAQPQTSWK